MTDRTHKTRFNALLEAMERERIDRLWIEPSVNLLYLTGIETLSVERLAGVLVSGSGEVRVLAPQMLSHDFASLAGDVTTWTDDEGPEEATARILRDVKKVHVQGSLPMWSAQALRRTGVRLAIEPGLIGSLRVRKDARERELLARSAAATDEVVAWLDAQDLSGLTERQLAGRIKARYLELGSASEVVVIVASGPNAALAHHLGSEEKITDDVPLLTDFGAAIDHYWSDITRVHFPRDLDAEVRRAYDVVCAAADAALDRVEVGIPCAEVDRAARRVIEDAGFGEHFTHRTGHGIGLEIHEPPYMTGANEQPLEVGHAFTIEPGVYLPGRWGLRYENDVVLDDDGPSVLNQSPRMHHL